MTERHLVLLGPGWTNVKTSWFSMQGKFNSEGFDTIVAPYGDGRGFGRIENHAEKLAKLLKVTHRHYDHITYVGHSMGGLVGRYLIQNMDEGKFIDSYVSLGSPHKGNVFASLAFWSESAQQMQTGSKFLTDLNNSPWPGTPALALGGEWDVLVPQWSSRFEHAENILLPKTTHVSLVLNPRTFLEIWNWLIFEVLDVELKANQRGLSSKVS